MTEQEEFWKGPFGHEYTRRNTGRVILNAAFFSRLLPKMAGLESVVEFGAGAGENLAAIASLQPKLDLAAVEINETALQALAGHPRLAVFVDSMLTFSLSMQRWSLAFTKGVLIHIAPEDLPRAYETLYASSKRYVLVAEYFSASPREVPYRGHEGKMWTRDFGGEMLDRYPALRLIDCGFSYNRTTGQDNITHWLMEKV